MFHLGLWENHPQEQRVPCTEATVLQDCSVMNTQTLNKMSSEFYRGDAFLWRICR